MNEHQGLGTECFVPKGQAGAGLSVRWQGCHKHGGFPCHCEETQFFPCVGHPHSKGRSRQATRAQVRRLQLPAVFWPSPSEDAAPASKDGGGRSPLPLGAVPPELEHLPALRPPDGVDSFHLLFDLLCPLPEAAAADAAGAT